VLSQNTSRNKIGNLYILYKTSLLHRPDDYIGFTPSCPPPHFTTKLRPCLRVTAVEVQMRRKSTQIEEVVKEIVVCQN